MAGKKKISSKKAGKKEKLVLYYPALKSRGEHAVGSIQFDNKQDLAEFVVDKAVELDDCELTSNGKAMKTGTVRLMAKRYYNNREKEKSFAKQAAIISTQNAAHAMQNSMTKEQKADVDRYLLSIGLEPYGHFK